ncbi:MAG: hypothetical protein CMC07_06065 [Flavobacteriaceae bacterium]|nr:hypothetical protein [Flavobacteriaceae bacterium]|tara:strand:+ start:264 stop:638 length:375 start_codon:yes stop_codon:yes gene_type:complete
MEEKFDTLYKDCRKEIEKQLSDFIKEELKKLASKTNVSIIYSGTDFNLNQFYKKDNRLKIEYLAIPQYNVYDGLFHKGNSTNNSNIRIFIIASFLMIYIKETNFIKTIKLEKKPKINTTLSIDY